MATKKSREICIIGLGRFGSAIADQLLKDKKNKIKLVLIDKDEKHLIPFKDEVNAIYVADAAERKTLEAINVVDFDVVIVATSKSTPPIKIAINVKICKAYSSL